jgi:hypothetical protein
MSLINFKEFQVKKKDDTREGVPSKTTQKKEKKKKKQDELLVSEEGFIMVGNKKVRYNSDLMRTIYFLLFGVSSRNTILELARQYLQIMELIIHKELEKES